MYLKTIGLVVILAFQFTCALDGQGIRIKTEDAVLIEAAVHTHPGPIPQHDPTVDGHKKIRFWVTEPNLSSMVF